MGPQTQDTVDVNLIAVIDSIVRAGKLYQEHHHEIDKQLLMVRDRDVAGVYLDAAKRAKEFFDKGEHPALRSYDRALFDIGYDKLISGEISVCLFPGSD